MRLGKHIEMEWLDDCFTRCYDVSSGALGLTVTSAWCHRRSLSLLSIALRACYIFWRETEWSEGRKGHDDADANTIHDCAYYEDKIILRRLTLLIPRLLRTYKHFFYKPVRIRDL